MEKTVEIVNGKQIETMDKVFRFRTIPELLHLDWEANILRDEALRESAANLINWEFREKYCKNLPEEWWFHTDINSMYIMINDFWRISFVLPPEFEEDSNAEYFGYEDAENIRSLKIGLFKLRNLEAYGLLSLMKHPVLTWICDKIMLIEKSGIPMNITDKFNINILLITALYDLIKNGTSFPPHLKGDFLMINDSLVKTERF